MGFAKPSRSPGPLVSSYLTVSPLPPTGRKGQPEAVCFLWHFPDPYGWWALPTIAARWSPDFPLRKPHVQVSSAERSHTHRASTLFIIWPRLGPGQPEAWLSRTS